MYFGRKQGNRIFPVAMQNEPRIYGKSFVCCCLAAIETECNDSPANLFSASRVIIQLKN